MPEPQTQPDFNRPARMNAATLAQYQHEERMAQAAKPPREDRPAFTLKRSTASGSLGAVGADVFVPVCDEYPTANDAFEASLYFMDAVVAHFPINGAEAVAAKALKDAQTGAAVARAKAAK